MKNYTAGSAPVFSEKIKIVEITDLVHADNANAASKQLIENDLALKAMLEKKMEPEEGMGLSHNDYTDEDRDKLAGIDEGANCYRHPESHPASMIEQDSTHRFVSGTKQLYRVQVGAYTVKGNATAMQAKLKAAGFDGIVVKG